MLSKEYIEKLVRDETKSFLRAVFKEAKGWEKIGLQRSLNATRYEMYNTIKLVDHYFPNYEKNLKRFLESGEWINFLFMNSPVFRFLCFLGLPEEVLLDTFIFVTLLDDEDKKKFFMLFLYKIWKELKKEDNLIDYLTKKYENLKRKHERQLGYSST